MTTSDERARLTFDPQFLFATDNHGNDIRFTRAERALLLVLADKPGTIFARERLLDAISGVDSETIDRNVDFVINRLRRKLGDSARNPTYIATQYGEGYWWIPETRAPRPSTANAFVVIGPVRGLPSNTRLANQGRRFAKTLCQHLDAKTADQKKVVIDETCPLPSAFGDKKPQFALELDFLVLDERLDCAITTKDFTTGQVIFVTRQTAACDQGNSATSAHLEPIAEEVVESVWNAITRGHQSAPSPADEPLALRINDAAQLLTDTQSAVEAERRLRTALQQNPDDHQTRVMLATAIHSKYILGGPMAFTDADQHAKDEDEIESLVLAAIPYVQHNGSLALAAAKLLYFLSRGYDQTALSMAEKAFRTTTAFATSFAVLGQMYMFEGEIDEAIRLFDEGIALSTPKSEFEVFLLVLKCQAALASGSPDRLEEPLAALYRSKPETRQQLGMFFSPSTNAGASFKLKTIAKLVSAKKAATIVSFTYSFCARLFKNEHHRINIMKGHMTLIGKNIGYDFVPDNVRQGLPSFFENT